MNDSLVTPEKMFQYDFIQLARYENGRTPVLLTEDQYRLAKACVNACKRFPIEVLEAAAACGGIVHEPVEELLDTRKQRDELLAAALWALWHHQGASSVVGQPIRKLLGMGQFDRLTDEQLRQAKAFGWPDKPAAKTESTATISYPLGSLGEEVAP